MSFLPGRVFPTITVFVGVSGRDVPERGSACTATKSSSLSTANVIVAVSATCQTRIAAISTGFRVVDLERVRFEVPHRTDIRRRVLSLGHELHFREPS